MARTRVWKKDWVVMKGEGASCKGSCVNNSGSSSGSVGCSLVDGQPQQVSQKNRRLSLASHVSTNPQYVRSEQGGVENVDPNQGYPKEKGLVDKTKVFSEQELKHFLVLLLEWSLRITKSTENLRNMRSFSLCELVSLHFGNGEIFMQVLKSAGVVNLSWAWWVNEQEPLYHSHDHILFVITKRKTFGKPPDKYSDPKQRLDWNFKVLGAVSADIGVPEEFIVEQKDCFMQVVDTMSVVKLIANLALVSRFCTQQGFEACKIETETLEALGVPVFALTSKPHRKLQEMSCRGSFWVPNDFSDNCLLCEEPFSTFNWRHHCRKCGILCCARCSQYRSKCYGYTQPQRVCLCCANSPNMHLVQTSDMSLLDISLTADNNRLNMTIM